MAVSLDTMRWTGHVDWGMTRWNEMGGAKFRAKKSFMAQSDRTRHDRTCGEGWKMGYPMHLVAQQHKCDVMNMHQQQLRSIVLLEKQWKQGWYRLGSGW